LKKLIKYYTPGQTEITPSQAYTYAALIVFLYLIRTLFYNWLMIEMTALGMKIRIACSSLIYRKTLKMKKHILQKITEGQIINLLSNDVTRFNELFAYLHFVWIGPVQIAIAICYLDLTLGHIALTGIGILILCLIFQSSLHTLFPS
jgi:ATP-binding cassette subfamily C (CFTR/MRP) protein 4